MTNTGIAMMLKAMGINPDELMAKGLEVEAALKNFAAQTHQQMVMYDQRLSRIEQMLMLVIQKQDQALSPVSPAGDTLMVPVALVVEKQTTEQETTKTNGRYTGRAHGESGAARGTGRTRQ